MTNPLDGTNYYEVLEVAPDAPPHEIHKAYQRAKATYSSDNPALYSMFSPEEARELLRMIEEAYSVLGNPGLRRTYDDTRARGILAPMGVLLPNQPPAPQAQPNSMMTNDPAKIASAHQSLPDFTPPNNGRSETAEISESATKTNSSAKSALPPGTGKTTLSTYKIDEAFENELANAGDFDGNLLQRIRLYKNISIDRMSEATRISRPYLMAVETNDFKSLPAAVFVRGFVVQVSRILGLNEQKVANSYMKMFRAGGGK